MVKKLLKSVDYPLVIAIMALALFGVIMVFSASSFAAVTRYGAASDLFFKKQLLSLCLGTVAFFIVTFIPYKLYMNSSFVKMAFFGSVLSLSGLFLFGTIHNNARSWYDFAGGRISFQPLELVKVLIIIYLSATFTRKQAQLKKIGHVLPPVVFLVVVLGLIMFQPDFGGAFILLVVSCAIILASGVHPKVIMRMIGILLVGFFGVTPVLLLFSDSVQFFSKERLSRLTTYQNPFADASHDGYQMVNSYIAIGNGGLEGVGLGKSIQKFGYLPEAHTDFIMAIIAEELGFLGVIIVLGLLAFIVLRGYRISMRCTDQFGSLVAIGLTTMVGFQAFINLGGLTGVIPLTGVTLPLVSYGGTSMMMMLGSLAILSNISLMNNYEAKFTKANSNKQ